MRSAGPGAGGWTLIEALIVLMVLGIVSTASWEVHKSIARFYRLDGASRMLYELARSLRLQAVATRQTCWIQFEPDRNGYSVWTAEADGGSRLLRRVALAEGVGFGAGEGVKGPPSAPTRVPESDGITFRDNRLVIKPGGGMGGGAGTVYMTERPKGERTHAMTVTVPGRVRLYRWASGGWK